MGRPPGARNKPKDTPMATKTADRTATEGVADQAQSKGEVAIFQPPRLPYHPLVEERFGLDKGTWKVLVEAIFPAAQSVDSVVMALSYCKSRSLDIMKRPVHIVPMWDSKRGGYVETVWPGISELRTTASRTKGYAGCDVAEYGDIITNTFEGRVKRSGNWENETVELEFPEWCRLTVYRIVDGQRCKFVGPKVVWMEAYATQGNSGLPNKMWQERPEGQLEKCAEAAALRRAFPEEMGNELTAEEMTGRNVHDLHVDTAAGAAEALADTASRDTAPPRQITAAAPPPAEPPHDPEQARDGTPPPRRAPANDPISSGPPRTTAPPPRDKGPSAAPVEPSQIPGAGETFESWAAKYTDYLKTSPDMATAYKWIDVNAVPLGRLAKGKPSVYATVKKATEQVIQTLRDAQEKAAQKAAKKAAPPPSDMDDPGPGQNDMMDFDEPAPGPKATAHAAPPDPEAILATIDRELGAVEEADQLSDVWVRICEPLLDPLFPPDKDNAQAIYHKHEKRLGGD